MMGSKNAPRTRAKLTQSVASCNQFWRQMPHVRTNNLRKSALESSPGKPFLKFLTEGYSIICWFCGILNVIIGHQIQKMNDSCPQCGFVNPAGMRFCGNCGARLEMKSASQTPRAEITPDQLGAMIGADLLERFRKAGLEARGQRRNVTILFADISGFTHLSTRIDEEVLYDLIRQYSGILARDVYKYEGMVDKFTGDGLMALFGAPIALENNAELGVRAAMDMLSDVANLGKEMNSQIGIPLHIRVGIHSGSVIVGGIGSNMLMNYTAIGDTVNLAHRLENATQPGTIMVSETVYRQTSMLFDYEAQPGLLLKGFDYPITGYRALQAKETPGLTRGIEGLHAPMVGREQELTQLQTMLNRTAAKQPGQFALIVGEAGLGKSRLVRELKDYAHEIHVPVLEGQSLTYRRSVIYWIFQDLLRNYLNVTADMSSSETGKRLIEKVVTLLPERASEIIPYLEHLLSLPISDVRMARRIEYLDASQLRQQIFMAVRSILRAEMLERPLLIILEDLHWADDTSLELLQFLLETMDDAPLFILAISRPFQEGLLQKITDQAALRMPERFALIQLKSLSPKQSQELLVRLLSLPKLPENLREQIVRQASGIPFYLEEIVRMLIDQGVLQRTEYQWNVNPQVNIENLGVPNSLQGLILARFDRVDPVQRQVLQVASVVGREFNRSVVKHVVNKLDDHEIVEALSVLMKREFIEILDEGGIYAFRHAIVSDAIYSTLLKRDRTELHGQVGEAIEELYADQLETQIDLLARHFSWSDKKHRALHYLLLAGQKAARSYIGDQARIYYQDAIELLGQIKHHHRQAIQIYMGMGDILNLMGEYPTARQHYEQALRVIQAEAPRQYVEERSSLHRRIGATNEHQGDYSQALTCLAIAQEILNEDPMPSAIEKALILNDIGWIQFRRGNMDSAEENLLKALSLAQQTPRHDVTASIYNRLGGVYYDKEDLDKAIDYVQKSLALREEIGDYVAVARTYNNLGLLDLKRGQWDSSLVNFNHCLDLHANLGDVEGIIDVHGNLGLLQLDRGNIQEAYYHFQQSLEKAKQIGLSYIVAITYMYLSRLYVQTGEWQKSLEYGQLSLSTFIDIGALDEIIDVFTNLGLATLGMGNIDEAERWAWEARNSFGQTETEILESPTDDRGRALRLLGDISLLKNDHEKAREYYQKCQRIFEILNDRLEQARTTLAMGLLAKNCNDPECAQTLFDDARRAFKQLGANLDLNKLENIISQYPNP